MLAYNTLDPERSTGKSLEKAGTRFFMDVMAFLTRSEQDQCTQSAQMNVEIIFKFLLLCYFFCLALLLLLLLIFN